ncbi:hypothetical protein E2605_09750 [Dysgonomonas capnocytophagoides]|uniref:Uncharacterized protein n=1 Tax=Dysgonomonas capnocytophagoides TaxID=45254 RepID=A0A4Y8L5T8_9BACT|nr:hypothetical protein [Dysgonomonas capnocytophagoides]TFD96440.1 hypothetical protein E2605_09750 [Dysgonomonas capnocytophagoides]
MGLPFSDIEQLKSEHLVKDNNGYYGFDFYRQICGSPVCVEKGVLFCVSTNQPMNGKGDKRYTFFTP